MYFTKMQGAGNDFIIIDTRNMKRDGSRLAKAMCDRHFGIGADGLLLFSNSKVADFRMRIFNADGSEAGACGNGLRCMVKYFLDKGVSGSRAQEITVETVEGVRRARVHKAKNKIPEIQVNMGKPKFSEKDIPVKIKYRENLVDIKSMLIYSAKVGGKLLHLNLASMGNPHAVHFCHSSVSEFPLSRIGHKVEKLDIFPNGVNFEIARVLDRQHIESRVWERGVGETLACGTGACATTIAARLHGYIDNKVDIKVPGGTLGVEWDGVKEVFLSGPAETVFTGEWPDERLV